MGPFLLLINWNLVWSKSVFMKSLIFGTLWDRGCISNGTLCISYNRDLWSYLCSWNPFGTVCAFLMGPFLLLINWTLVMKYLCSWEFLILIWVFLMGPFLLLINWTLVKSVFMKSLWDRVCISYGTLPITHKLIFGKMCVHEILMGPCVYFLWDPSYYS